MKFQQSPFWTRHRGEYDPPLTPDTNSRKRIFYSGYPLKNALPFLPLSCRWCSSRYNETSWQARSVRDILCSHKHRLRYRCRARTEGSLSPQRKPSWSKHFVICALCACEMMKTSLTYIGLVSNPVTRGTARLRDLVLIAFTLGGWSNKLRTLLAWVAPQDVLVIVTSGYCYASTLVTTAMLEQDWWSYIRKAALQYILPKPLVLFPKRLHESRPDWYCSNK
jgi:hypothetical protein